jgi:hypothetical protein
MHDQRMYPGEIRTVAEVGVTAALGFELQIPFRVTRTTVEYTTPSGASYQPLDPALHHRNETLAGIGDPWLLGRYMTGAGNFLVAGRAGVSVPLGRTVENPFELGAMGVRHQHIQFGNGTFDPVIALDVSRIVGGLQASAYAQAQLPFDENRHGFRAGNRISAGLRGGRQLFENLVGALAVDVLHDGAERWGGRIRQDGNLGRTEILFGLSAQQTLGTTVLGVGVLVPVYRHIVPGDDAPGTLSSPLMLSLSVSQIFGRAHP